MKSWKIHWKLSNSMRVMSRVPIVKFEPNAFKQSMGFNVNAQICKWPEVLIVHVHKSKFSPLLEWSARDAETLKYLAPFICKHFHRKRHIFIYQRFVLISSNK